jgi:hypothetical protein
MAIGFGSAITKAITAIKSLDVQHGKPVVDIVDPRKTVVPVAMASVLFFTWGLAYGLLDVMNVSSPPSILTSVWPTINARSITSALPWALAAKRRHS